jgi:hypothetical protein
LLRLANTYKTITLTIVEAVQNALDADAEKVFIGIDVKGRVVCVLDDGNGVTEEKFQQALLSVGKTVKPRRGTLGRFGLGLISPLNKCVRYVFASHPLGVREANIWTFIGEDIKAQRTEVKIPFEQAPSLPPIPKQFVSSAGQLYARWRTIVHLSDVVEDRVVGVADLEELESQIREKFRKVMLQKGTTVHVVIIDEQGVSQERCIDASDYTGEPLEIVSHTEEACGKVTFELYRAVKSDGVRSGVVSVMRAGDISPITWKEFHGQAWGSKKLKHVKEAFDVLASGYFEGVITAAEIELEPDRKSFKMGDALDALYVAIYAWYLNRGKALYEDEQEIRRENRWKSLGQRSLEKVLAKLNDSQTFAPMARKLFGVLPDQRDEQPKPSNGPRPRQPGKPATPEPKTERRRVVADPPQREKRPSTPVRPNLALSFAYAVMAGSTQLWQFDMDTGVLTFNVLHPTWVKLDETNGKHTTRNDRQIMQLQEWLALKLLLLLSHYDDPDFEFDTARVPIDEEAKYYAEMIIIT